MWWENIQGKKEEKFLYKSKEKKSICSHYVKSFHTVIQLQMIVYNKFINFHNNHLINQTKHDLWLSTI